MKFYKRHGTPPWFVVVTGGGGGGGGGCRGGGAGGKICRLQDNNILYTVIRSRRLYTLIGNLVGFWRNTLDYDVGLVRGHTFCLI